MHITVHSRRGMNLTWWYLDSESCGPSHKHKAALRQQSSVAYTHRGKPVCAKVFRFLHGVGMTISKIVWYDCVCVCSCVCVCVCVCVSVCVTHTCIHTHTHKHSRTHTHTSSLTHTHTHTHIQAFTHTHSHTSIHAHAHTCTRVCSVC